MSLLRIQSVVKLFGRRLSGYAQPLRFKDKVAVVTGGCQGIGRGCVDVLAEHGGKVIALDITDDIGSKIESSGPGEITYMHCDVTKEDEVKKTIEEVAARFTKIDCLVNNVGGRYLQARRRVRSSGCTQPLRFKDKVAVVTGGCQGIGRGCVDVFAEHGGKVVALDITDEIGSKIEPSGPGEIIYMHCDVTKEDEVKKVIEEVAARFAKIDCLINNVGCHPGANSIDGISVDDFRKTIELNLVSNFTVSKYALPYIRKCEGSVVNISSMVTTTGWKNSSTYCATKGGVASLTKALAIDEAKYGVRVNAVSPSNVRTPLYEAIVPEEMKQYLNSCHQLKRSSQAREIGLACLFLAVDATFTTGEEFKCSGGSELGYGVKDQDALF